MRTYIAKRSLLFIPTLLIVTIVIFGILRVVPGDPAGKMPRTTTPSSSLPICGPSWGLTNPFTSSTLSG